MKLKSNPVAFVATAAVMIAAEIVLNRFCSINTMGLKIGFAFIPPTLAAILYGPGMGAAVWALADLLGAIVFPMGPYHPGFTVCAALMGALAGFMLYPSPAGVRREGERETFFFSAFRKRVRFFPNVVVTVVFNCLVLGLLVNTAWVSMLYGSRTYTEWLLYRLGEYAVLVPVQLALTPALLKLGEIIRKQPFFGKRGRQ